MCLRRARPRAPAARLTALLLAASAVLAAAVPTPLSHFGHEMGADRTVLDWDKVVSYFHLLARASDRIRVEELGKTTEGRPFLAATIADPETLSHLDRYREIQRRLADPRATTEAEAERLVAQGKTVVLLTCSIHSTEIASTHSVVEFAYRLLAEDRPRLSAILQNTILLLVPSLNPDGLDLVTRWYRRTLGTLWEGTNPPELYQKYVGHDNNRDWYIFSQAETRLTVARLHNVWHPQIVYDMHQQGPYGSRLFVPPWMDPIEPNVDAILMQETNMIGTAMAADLTAAGKVGISIHSSYDFWTPSRHYQAFHGGLRILTESASARLASPITVAPEQLDRNALGYDARERSWNFLEPWPGGTWRLRDIVEYQLIAMESCLYQAAIHREELLRNFYRVGQRQAARRAPWGFLIPARQPDPGAARKLLETLAFGQVDIDLTPNGGHVIPMAQPYSGYAKALLERQDYPDLRMYPGGPPRRPYDVTAHTLPLLMGVDVQPLAQPVAGPLVPARFPQGEPAANFAAADTDTWKTVNRIWSTGGSVWRNPVTGDFAPSPQGPAWKRLRRPRIGLHRSFVPSMDEGWTRWLLEQFGFAYRSLPDAEIRAGRLRDRFDVLVFPDEPAEVIESGFRPGSMPPEYTGGLGESGAQTLREFVSAGGTILFLNRSTEYALRHLGVPARNVVRGLPERDFYAPGSLLYVRLQPGHPLALGLPAEIAVWSEHSPAWETGEGVVARYPASGVLASGWLLGESYLANHAALVDAPLGRGRVILFGMRPQYRAQSYRTFKLFFNALLYF
ncbi:MAG TPA: M14 metallopeptidase family protein [Bryobacteraceae bacterium]|nr:M14 metallopeptidase family protein [Bryobacteraceae bacterium]